ncbi:angiopoietin-1 receptor-like [Lytechinus pictus]|uniref:angiopoietin-1 receptor-like n=1 Tax=Lytechinus pictus TaxID=7653 RepID=UPI0030B9BF0F
MNFNRLVVIAFLLNLYEACISVYISSTSRGYTSAETGEPFFECYRNAPDLTAQVYIGRYVYTYNDIDDPANDNPFSSDSFLAGNPSTQVYRVNLDTSQHRSYGVFYCAAVRNGEFSAVPTIFLRSDAKFLPRSGRFTKTVNTGDVNVTVDFTEVTPIDTIKEWRFNGTTSPFDTISQNTIFESLTVYTIVGKVDTSDKGVYEIHLRGERGLARAGLQRLIVRACPAGRYNESSGCTQLCSSCYNGGICHDQTGECICPPGFQGDSCERVCGGNRFGRNCEYRCDYDLSDDKTACSGLQVCVPDPYGCSCTPGYKGLDCTTECDIGEFGASCTETCHCVSGGYDRFTGVCTGSSSDCESEWTGTNCQECVSGRCGPNCEPFTVKYEKVNRGQYSNFFCQLNGDKFISTAAPVVNIYRKLGSGNFTQQNIISIGATPFGRFAFLVTDVNVGETFACSIHDVNECWSESLTADGEFTQPELRSSPVVTRRSNESITLMWDAWDAATDIGDPPLLRYRIYYRVNDPEEQEQQVPRSDPLAPSERVTGLSPDTDYVFAVAAVRPGVGGGGPRLEVQGTTKCSPPFGLVQSINVSSSSLSRTLNIKWKNPISDANCRSGLTGVRIYWNSVEVSTVSRGSIDVPLNVSMGFDLSLPEPYTTYIITMAILNRDSEGDMSQPLLDMTAEDSAPPPSEIEAEIITSVIIVTWNASLPLHLNGHITGYTINYKKISPTIEDAHSESIITSQVTDIYVIKGVQEGEVYEIRVNTVNGLGPGEWSRTLLIEVFGYGPRYHLKEILLSALIPSSILLIILILLLLKRRQSHRTPHIQNENKHDDGKQTAGASETYVELYERPSNEAAAYQDLDLTAVRGSEPEYINGPMVDGPRGRKNVVNSKENNDC